MNISDSENTNNYYFSLDKNVKLKNDNIYKEYIIHQNDILHQKYDILYKKYDNLKNKYNILEEDNDNYDKKVHDQRNHIKNLYEWKKDYEELFNTTYKFLKLRKYSNNVYLILFIILYDILYDLIFLKASIIKVVIILISLIFIHKNNIIKIFSNEQQILTEFIKLIKNKLKEIDNEEKINKFIENQLDNI